MGGGGSGWVRYRCEAGLQIWGASRSSVLESRVCRQATTWGHAACTPSPTSPLKGNEEFWACLRLHRNAFNKDGQELRVGQQSQRTREEDRHKLTCEGFITATDETGRPFRLLQLTLAVVVECRDVSIADAILSEHVKLVGRDMDMVWTEIKTTVLS